MCGRIVVGQDPVAIPPFFRSFSVKIASYEPTDIPQSSAIFRTVNILLLRKTVLTLAIIFSSLDVDGRFEQGSLSTEVLTYSPHGAESLLSS